MLPTGTLRETRNRPYLTYGLIFVNLLVFIYTVIIPDQQLYQVYTQFGVIPARVAQEPFGLNTLVTMISAMFLHGGWLHFFGNMVYLWAFGPNVEDHLGKRVFFGAYFLTGFAAHVAQIMINPASPIPMIGASGAIAGVMGLYILLYPGVKVKVLIPLFRILPISTTLPALAVLGFWFAMQLFAGVASLGAPSAVGGGVAFFAHIGGFVAGLLIAFIHMMRVPAPKVSIFGD